MANEIDESSFLDGIGYEPKNMFGTWDVYAEIFELAKQRQYRVIGIDTLRKGSGPGGLKRRDLYTAKRIAREHRTHPERLIAVFIDTRRSHPSPKSRAQ